MKAHPPTFKRSFELLAAMVLGGSLFFVTTQTGAEDCNKIRAQYQCPTQKHRLHLSFDDGVGSVTPQILDILKKENIKATFLILGNKIDCGKYAVGSQSHNLCAQRFEILKRIKREGHDIGSHSYEHHHHSKLSPAELQDTIAHSRHLLEPFFTTEPPVFRLPYGDGWFNQKKAPQVMEALKRWF